MSARRIVLDRCKGCQVPLHHKDTPEAERRPGSKQHRRGQKCNQCAWEGSTYRPKEYREPITEGVEPDHLTKFLESRRRRGVPVGGVLMAGEK